MKKITKSFIVSFLLIMLCSHTALADDISGYKHEDEVRLMIGMGIMNGYEDGSFRPEEDVTRAEFITMLVRTLGFKDEKGGAAAFWDMNDHWASGNVSIANQIGIANGHEDGSFAPDEKVLCQEAVKFINNALGYTDIAEKKGGYPNGDMVVATESGLLKNILAGYETPLTRGEIAKLLSNALETPTMGVVGLEDERFQMSKGETLLEYLGYTVRKVVVTSAYGGNLDGNNMIGKNRITADEKLYYTSFDNGIDYLGMLVEAYIYDAGGSDEEIRYMQAVEKNSKITVNGDCVDEVKLNSEIQYSPGGKKKSIKLSNLTILKNGQILPTSEVNENLFYDRNCKIDFIDNDRDGKYDIALIWSFADYIAERVSKDKIYCEYNKSIDLTDADEKEITVVCDGKNVTLADIKPDDVVSAAVSADGTKIRAEITRNKKYGTVIGYGETTDEHGNQIKYFETETNGSYETAVFSDLYNDEYTNNRGYFTKPEVGDTGVFYFNQFGKLVYVNVGAALDGDYSDMEIVDRSKYKYGYFTYKNYEDTEMAVVEILTADNSFEKFIIKDDLRIGAYTNGSYSVRKLKMSEICKVLDKETNQIVKYVVDENGNLTELCFSRNGENTSVWGSRTDAKTSNFANFQIEQQYIVDATTICFYIPVKTDSDSWKVSKAVTMLKSGNSYKAAMYDIVDGVIGVLVYTPTLSTTRYKYILDYVNSPVMLIDKVSSKYDEASGETVNTILGWVGGEYKEVAVSNTLESNSNTADNLRKGMLIQYLLNTEKKSFARFKNDSDAIILFNVICDFNTLEDEFITWDYASLTDVNARIKVYKGTVDYVADDTFYVEIDDISYAASMHEGTSIMTYDDGICEKAEIEDITVGTEVVVRQRYNNTRDIFIIK